MVAPASLAATVIGSSPQLAVMRLPMPAKAMSVATVRNEAFFTEELPSIGGKAYLRREEPSTFE
jgi:hypothetical protein